MWAVVVEVDAPCRHQIAGMAQSVEEVLVQAFVPHPAIKGLHKAILHWFARRDVMPVNLPVLLPLQDRIRSQFGSVVADHHAGIASHLGDPIQLTGYADAGQGRINDGSQTFSAEVVDHIQDTLSDTKSSDHLWFGPCGIAMGVLVPSARLRPPRLRTVNPSSR